MLPQWSSVRVTLTAQLTLPLIIHRYGFNRAHPRDDQRQRIRLPCYARIVSSRPVVLNSEPRNITLRLLNIYIYLSTRVHRVYTFNLYYPTNTNFFFNDKSNYSSNLIFGLEYYSKKNNNSRNWNISKRIYRYKRIPFQKRQIEFLLRPKEMETDKDSCLLRWITK